MHILIADGAGFIGSAMALQPLEREERVTGLENLNDYYRFVDWYRNYYK